MTGELLEAYEAARCRRLCNCAGSAMEDTDLVLGFRGADWIGNGATRSTGRHALAGKASFHHSSRQHPALGSCMHAGSAQLYSSSCGSFSEALVQAYLHFRPKMSRMPKSLLYWNPELTATRQKETACPEKELVPK